MDSASLYEASTREEPFARHALVGAIATAVGVLLLVTAALKVLHSTESAALQTVYDLPLWLMIGVVQVELIVGLMLISGLWNRSVWLGAITLFTAFAAFSLYRALAGFESCGCFGPLRVSPWATFTLDVAIAVILASLRRTLIPVASGRRPYRAFAWAGAYLLLAGSSTVYLLSAGPKVWAGGNSAIDDTGLVILEPEKWSGQRFPLSEHFSPRVELTRGEWIVLLYHHDCPQCQEALPKYERLAADALANGDRVRVLLVEVPPYASDVIEFGRAFHVRLSDKREWFVQSPVEIQLNEGKVVVASHDLPSIVPQTLRPPGERLGLQLDARSFGQPSAMP